MSSGVQVDDNISDLFKDFKINKKNRYYTFLIENKEMIKVDKVGGREASYEDFCDDLPEKSPRYCLIDLDFETKDGRPTSKIVFISWIPEEGGVRDKMLYASSKEAIKLALDGVGIFINATDRAELDLETSILPVVKKFG